MLTSYSLKQGLEAGMQKTQVHAPNTILGYRVNLLIAGLKSI